MVDENAHDSVAMGELPASPIQKTCVRAQDPDAELPWSLEPHVCRHCFGRLVSTPAAGGGRWFLCTNCGSRGDGEHASSLCCCGITIRSTVPGAPPTDALVRCQPNPSPTPEFPSLFVAAEMRI